MQLSTESVNITELYTKHKNITTMQFRNFIDWVSPTTEDGRDLNQTTSNLMPHTAQIGDFWRVLIHKSHFRGNGPEEVTATLAKQNLSCAGVWNQTWSGTEYQNVVCRRQLSERYTEFTIQVNDVSTEENPKQFALVRANGQTLLPTITAQGTTAEEYAQAIKEAWEAYAYASVFIQRNGTSLRVRIFHNTNFLFRDENVTIGLGSTNESNINSPSLVVQKIGQTVYAQRNSWELYINDVEEGNIFTLGSTKCVVQASDTPETVMECFLNGNSRYIVNSDVLLAINAEKGSKQVVNRNNPSILLTYFNTVAGKDRYIVQIGEDVLPGNIYEITANSTTPKRAVAVTGDTASTIAAQLVSISGYYEVNTGITPTEKVVLGALTVINDNNPLIELRDLQVLPAETLNKYLVLISQDIVAGNIFTYEGAHHLAVDGDTPDSIAKVFGFTANADVVEALTSPVGFASAGQKTYGLASIRLVQAPIVRRSNQFIVEVNFSGLTSGVYNVKLDCFTHILYSNNITVKNQATGTKMLEVADRGNVYDYDYAEAGLTQRIRLQMHTHFFRTRTMENRSKLLSGEYRRSVTAIERNCELMIPAQDEYFHSVMSAWLKHANVWIDGESFYVEGEYAEASVPNWQKSWGASAILVENEDKDNKGRYVTTSYLPTGYGKAILTGFWYGLEVMLISSEIQVLIKGNQAAIPAGEYELIIWNDGDKRKIKAGVELFLGEDTARVPSRSVARWRRWIRIEPSLTTTIYCERLTDNLAITYEDAPADPTLQVTEFETEYGISHDYSNDYNEDHNI